MHFLFIDHEQPSFLSPTRKLKSQSEYRKQPNDGPLLARFLNIHVIDIYMQMPQARV